MKKSLNFDLDTNKLKEVYPNKNYTQAYEDIKRFLTKNGFEHRQGSGYISKRDMMYSEVTLIIELMGEKFSWLRECCKTLDYYSVGKSFDGLSKLNSKTTEINKDTTNVLLEPKLKNSSTEIAQEQKTKKKVFKTKSEDKSQDIER